MNTGNTISAVGEISLSNILSRAQNLQDVAILFYVANVVHKLRNSGISETFLYDPNRSNLTKWDSNCRKPEKGPFPALV